MVLGDSLARGLVKRDNRIAGENTQKLVSELDRYLEGKTKRASRYRAVNSWIGDSYSGRVLQESEIEIIGHKKDNGYLWIVHDFGRDPSTAKGQLIVVLLIVPFRNPGELIARELIVLTEHAVQRLLQSVGTADVDEAMAKATAIGEFAFTMFENGMNQLPLIPSCDVDHQLVVLDRNVGWMPTDVEAEQVKIRTVIRPDSLNPAKKRLFDVSIEQGKSVICASRK